MKLVATTKTFRFEHPSGYNFTVMANQDTEFGWGAEVAMRSWGFKTAEAAIEHLKYSAEAFLKQVAELEKETKQE